MTPVTWQSYMVGGPSGKRSSLASSAEVLIVLDVLALLVQFTSQVIHFLCSLHVHASSQLNTACAGLQSMFLWASEV